MEPSMDSAKVMFLVNSAAVILFMQAGFAMLEVGSVRMKNAKSILFKNMASFCLCGVVWWFWGFGLAGIESYSSFDDNAGSGASGQTGHGYVDDWHDRSHTAFLHSLSFACVTGTIVSGAITERMYFHAFLIFVVVVVGSIYPLLVQWCWGLDGWLYRDFSFRDYAGAGVIHLCGGVCSGVGAYILGPRLHKFTEAEDGKVIVNDIAGHSPTLSNLGVYILMLSWFFFNGSPVVNVTQPIESAARAMANTIVAAATSGTIGLMINQLVLGVHDLPAFHNSILVGFVGITGGSGYVSGYVAVIIGVASSIACIASSHMMLVLKIDDVVDAFAVHAAGGMIGLLSVGLFAERKWLDINTDDCGLFVGGKGSLLFGQLIGGIVIVTFSATITAITFLMMKYWPTGDQLRVPKDVELLGLDFMYHEGSAWPEFNPEKLHEAHDYKEAEKRAAETGKVRRRRKVSNLIQFPTSVVESDGITNAAAVVGLSSITGSSASASSSSSGATSSFAFGKFKLVPASSQPIQHQVVTNEYQDDVDVDDDDDNHQVNQITTNQHNTTTRSTRSTSMDSSTDSPPTANSLNRHHFNHRMINIVPLSTELIDEPQVDVNDLFDTVVKEPKLVIRNGKLMKI